MVSATSPYTDFCLLQSPAVKLIICWLWYCILRSLFCKGPPWQYIQRLSRNRPPQVRERGLPIWSNFWLLQLFTASSAIYSYLCSNTKLFSDQHDENEKCCLGNFLREKVELTPHVTTAYPIGDSSDLFSQSHLVFLSINKQNTAEPNKQRVTAKH